MMPSVGSRRKEKPRETRKKRPPRSCNFETAASRACAENHYCNYYTKFPAKCKPQSGRGRGCPPHVLEFTLTVIGAAGLVRQFARLIDWIER